jgi:hypothetical protein
MQQSLEEEYQQEIVRQQGRSLLWVYIVVNATVEPSTIAAMRINASTSVVLPIPLTNTTDPTTNATVLVANTTYYQMYLHNVNVYLLDMNGRPLGSNKPVKVQMRKSGHSSFLGCAGSSCTSTSDLELSVFSHQPIDYNLYLYDPVSGCAVTSSYCGDMCPDYIRSCASL